MTIPRTVADQGCEQRRAHGARRGVPAAACRFEKNLAARQGRAALSTKAPRPVAAAPTPRAPLAQKVTLRTPTHSLRGEDHAGLAMVGRVGVIGRPIDFIGLFGKWNRGTWLEPDEIWRKPLIAHGNSASGTVEPWNRMRAYARAGARRIWFHGSMVPEGTINRVFQSLSGSVAAVPARFHGSSNRKWGR